MARRYHGKESVGEQKKEKKKHGCGCVSFFLFFLILLIIGGTGLFFYKDYKGWQAQKAEFAELNQAAEKILVQVKDQDTATDSLKTLIRQYKKNSSLTNPKAEIVLPDATTTWASGNQVQIKTQAGLSTKNPLLEKSIKAENTITLECSAESITMVPSYVSQTGIKGDYTNYNYFFSKWYRDTNQRAIANLWNGNGRTQNNDIATLGGYYLVAVRPTFGKCGDILCVVLEDGTYFECIIADEKGDDAGNDWGHVKSSAISLVEFEVIGNDEDDQAPNFVPPAEWEGKRVSAIINKGTAVEVKDSLVSN